MTLNNPSILFPAKEIIDIGIVGPLTVLFIIITNIEYIINDIIPHIHNYFSGWDEIFIKI